MADLVGLEATYMQSPDDNSGLRDDQMLRIKAENAGAGFFFVIETERWAFDDIEELSETINDFKTRLEWKKNSTAKK